MKITGIQLFWMIMTMDFGMTLIMTLTPSMQAAKQDVWMSKIIAGIIVLLITFLVTKLAYLYPDQTLVQISQTILGNWLGKLVVLIYFIQWYTIIPIVLRQFTDMVDLMILPATPSTAIILIMVLLTAYATHAGGIVGIGRCSEILGPIIVVMVIVVLVANIPNIELKNILPVYVDSGIKNIIMGAPAPASYLGHAVEYLMLASFLYYPRKGAPYAYWAVIIATFFVLISTFMVVLTVGVNLTSKMWYPFFEMTKKISLFDFIENLDAVPIVIWVASVFIKLSVYLFITSYGTAQFLQIKNWRILIWFIAPVMAVFALFPQNVVQATSHYLLNYWVPVALPINMIGLPLLLLIVGKIKQRQNKQNTA